MSQRVTIPKEMHERMVRRLRRQYESEFGSITDDARSYTRDELVAKYARDVRFWRVRTPSMHPSAVTLPVVCAHAICTNAVAQLKHACEARGVWDDVEALVAKTEDAKTQDVAISSGDEKGETTEA